MSQALEDQPTCWHSGRGNRAGKGVASISLSLRRSTLAKHEAEEDTVSGKPISGARPPQRVLWVDGVGGFLLSLADELTLGQPGGVGHSGPDLAILADLSRRHARLSRRDGGYVLTPYESVTLDGRSLDGPTLIGHDAVIGLGSVRLRLRRPHALSATALLWVESGHRTVPAADAVLLMAECAVIGPGAQSHVVCPQASAEAILFRGSGGSLRCRSGGPLAVAGREVAGPVVVPDGERIEGQDFAFCVEQVAEA